MGTVFQAGPLWGSEETVYKELNELYRVYCTIGGYPAVVLTYLENRNIEQCQAVLEKIVHLFANESRRYFDDILEYDTYENIFTSAARILLKEKKGLDADSFSEELQSIVVKEYSSNLFKSSGKPCD